MELGRLLGALLLFLTNAITIVLTAALVARCSLSQAGACGSARQSPKASLREGEGRNPVVRAAAFA